MQYWNIAQQRHYRALSAMLLNLRVSADRAAWPPPHTALERAGFELPVPRERSFGFTR